VFPVGRALWNDKRCRVGPVQERRSLAAGSTPLSLVDERRRVAKRVLATLSALRHRRRSRLATPYTPKHIQRKLYIIIVLSAQ